MAPLLQPAGRDRIVSTRVSHQSRTVPIPRFLAREVAKVIISKNADDFIFTTPGGSVLRLSNWRRSAFQPACARSGLGGRFRIHDLRHTAASLMIQARYPPKMLQEIMGHASITTTLDLYTSILATWTATRTASTARPTQRVRPKQGQMTMRAKRPHRDQGVCLRRLWRARRDSNPQPSDP
jgi:integrase